METDVAEEKAAPASPPPGPATRDEGDVAPEHAVTAMVDKERAETDGRKDLLDSSRPVE